MKMNFFIACGILCCLTAGALLMAGCKHEVTDTPTAEQRFDDSIVTGSATRSFIVYQPANIQPAEKVPVVFMFHGAGGNGDKFYTNSGWKEKAAVEKFYAVFPSASTYCIADTNGVTSTSTHWAGYEFGNNICAGQTIQNDVQFVRDMVKYIQNHYRADDNRFYIAGFSNGAQFVFRLTIEAPDLFAAASLFAAPLLTPDKTPQQLIPVYQGVGNRDRVFLAGLHRTEPFPMDTTLLDIPLFKANMQNACVTYRLRNKYQFSMQTGYSTFAYTTPTGNNNNVFYCNLFKGLDHQYPNGSNYPLSAPDLVWDFFKQYSK
jgi:polyhydroxybutyrate depolymerase